ncbi:hypothetical protein [Mesorhizobium sp. M2A.F.Ca.ET.067.02.1.1]|uniref:hypothetical protein n=1 Tax=Mesorhizobium sp. M2A.F.Ca.ET.067.02.1.1 TaxID=2496749 RepID=UPI001FE00D91|nr:hypothetical protein [Mesorhizobium sp. M2A.F.Ca.ET.067.02.1.1]
MFNLKLAALAVTAFVAWNVAPASALTMKECGETYRAAKDGGTLNGMDWAAFRKEKCATSAAESVSADSVKTAEPAEKDTSAAVTPTVAPAGVPGHPRRRVQDRNAREGQDEDLPAGLPRQQGGGYVERPSLDPEGRRLLQPLQCQAEELIA